VTTSTRILRWLRRALAVLALMSLAWTGGAWALDGYGRAHVAPDLPGRFDAIVVAGAPVWRGGVPSKALRRRTLAAVELWKAGHAPLLVLTGGLGLHAPPEAQVAAALAREHGVPDSALRIEDRSQNTLENAEFSRELIGEKRVLVVTDAYHVLRSKLIYEHYFQEVGLVGIPLGQRPPLATSMREVVSLLAFALLVAPRWI
jgi:uncharacterized SAM-binding protein YcdF (DUF218 family)